MSNAVDPNDDVHCNTTYVFDVTEESGKPKFRIQRDNLYPNDPLPITSFSISGTSFLFFLRIFFFKRVLSEVWCELKKRKSQRYWEVVSNDNANMEEKRNCSQKENSSQYNQKTDDSDTDESDAEDSSHDGIENDELKKVVLYEVGLTRPWVRKMIESLPLAYRCVNYQFRFVLPTKEQLERNSM